MYSASNKKVPKGSHRMPDGSIMKDSDMKGTKGKAKSKGQRAKPKKKKPVKVEETCADTSRCSAGMSVKYADNLKVEKTLEKKKEVKESDIFEGVPPKSKSKKY
tara:strand:- start:1733 stop:2044 length:312 start_codon:yes stop_codon:yes gene_type:complete